MIVTVLWEDQLGAASRFGPHELLLACLCDDLQIDREILKHRIDSRPQKGNSSLRKALQKHLHRLARSGPVIAVVDLDQIHNLWPPKPPPPRCMSGITARFRQDANGDYDLVFLVRNMETLVETVCRAVGQDLPPSKPDPDQRDQLLLPAAWAAQPVRRAIRQGCASFDRLVTRVTGHLRPPA
jgi:hypothetical protein